MSSQFSYSITLEAIFKEGGLLAAQLPHFEFRPGQLEFARAVSRAIEKSHFIIAEAGTGTGKTLAYLVPALLSKKQVVVSTGTKTLQEQIFFKDIPFLKSILPVTFSAALMKGRNNYLCLRKFRHFQKQPLFDFIEDAQRFEQLKRWAVTTMTGDRSEIQGLPDAYQPWERIASTRETCTGPKCSTYKDCFITQMKQQAAKADIIIINHHLLMTDLIIRNSGYGELVPEYEVIILDEAHQLEAAATQHLGLTVSNYHVEELVRDIQRELSAASSDEQKSMVSFLTAILSVSRNFFEHFLRGAESFRLKEDMLEQKIRDDYEAVRDVLDALGSRIDSLASKSEELENCRSRALLMNKELTAILEQNDPAYVSWGETRGKGVLLHASPVEVGGAFEHLLYPYPHTVVFTSATLSTEETFSYFKRRLGLDRIAPPDELLVPSHFDFSSQALIYLPSPMADPNSEQFIAAAAQQVEQLVAITSGRALVLFTSYRNMEEVHRILCERLPYTVLLQGTRPRTELLQHFKEDVSSVLFATSSFWEGVDVMGEALSCVIVDRLPFASPADPLVAARIEHIAADGDNPFLSYQVPQAIIALRQGFGRLIRSTSDRGILCILDRRIQTRSYGKLFLESLPSCSITRDLTAVKQFIHNRSDSCAAEPALIIKQHD
jgi:ATP-dependent DNA helicase DinG